MPGIITNSTPPLSTNSEQPQARCPISIASSVPQAPGPLSRNPQHPSSSHRHHTNYELRNHKRREQLEDIDPSWCPTWPVEWQRAFHLTRQHLEQGGALPTEPGKVLVQSEDLGRWVRTQRLGWDKLTGVQQ